MRALHWGLLILILLTGFENCSGPSGNSSNGTSSTSNSLTANQSSQTIQGPYSFTQIIDDSLLSQTGFPIIQNSPVLRLSIDLSTGQLTVHSHATGHSANCALSNTDAQNLTDLLANVQICQISPSAGTITCEAIPSPDIQLNSGATTVLLAPITCGSGTQLCGDADATLRQILANLQSNLPAGCAGIQ